MDGAAADRAAHWHASRMAAFMLPGSAALVPAMSKAVPFNPSESALR
jgi:hypothetical protein